MADTRQIVSWALSQGPPKLIAIDHDDYHASHVGRTVDGRQWFLTTPFVPAVGGNPGREFIALFLFDRFGQFIEARIEDLGTRADMNREEAQRLSTNRLLVFRLSYIIID